MQQYSAALRVLLYVLSIVIWPVGVAMGIVFLARPDQESRDVGRICLVLGIVSVLLGCVLVCGLMFAPFFLRRA